MKSKIILSFGHLPKYAGGKQSSGLASVIWELSNNINQLGSKEYKLILAATDIHVKKTKIDATEIKGWLKMDLLLYLIIRPWLLIFYIFKAIKLNYKYQLPFFNYLIKLCFYHKTIKEVKPEYIHLHGVISVIFFEIWNIKKYKVIATIHGLSGQDKLIPNFQNFQKMEVDLCQKPLKFVVFISSEVLKNWVQAYGEPIWKKEVILNAYNENLFYCTKENTISNKNYLNIATIGSISLLKGQNRVLEAIKLIKIKNIHYLCIGNGKRNEIKALIEFAKKNNISFESTGYLPPEGIREKLLNVDYMILPSSSEGFGLVFLESIACGVPVILPKNLPIVKEENLLSVKNSILIEDESPEAIAKTLLNLNSYSFIKEEVSKTVLNYTWDKVAQEYINLFQKL